MNGSVNWSKNLIKQNLILFERLQADLPSANLFISILNFRDRGATAENKNQLVK